MARISWDGVINRAAQIVLSYETGVTLRQLFYRLVSEQLIPNKQAAYSRLSSLTAQARRDGWFPDLIDNTRIIRRPAAWDGAYDAMDALKRQYRRDRTEYQQFSIYIGVEKNALATLLASWFNEKGLPVLAFGGYPSQTFVNDIIEDIDRREKPAVLIYGGDFDATGVDILRDFEKRTQGVWDEVLRVALNEDQIAEHKLPPLPGKSWDPRAGRFEAMYGELVQVELDALPPDVLKNIYDEAVDQYFDQDKFERSFEQEEGDNAQLLYPRDIKRMFESLGDVLQELDDHEMSGTLTYEHADEIYAKYQGVFDEA